MESELRSLGIAVAIAIILLVGTQWWNTDAQPFATVVRTVGIPTLPDGTTVRDGLNRIQTGTLELITVHGARVVIEAPAEFRFQSSQILNLKKGRLRADVPSSAKGFTVVTPAGNAIDLGTKFAVEVSSETEAEVHVFEGEVIAQSKGSSQRQRLTASTAVRFSNNLPAEVCDVRQGAFVRDREVGPMAEALRAGQRERARNASHVLKQDPALLAWLDFDQPSDQDSAEFGAVIQGARWVQGRFPGTGAIDFVNSEDCVYLNLNSRTPKFALMTWVRLNQFEGRPNSLYSTDEWGDLGQVHWMIGNQDNIRFAIKGDTLTPRGDTNVWCESQPRSLTELERWVHLALVYDSEVGMAEHYLNGQTVAVAEMPKGLEASLGPAQLGNWKPQPDKDLLRRRLSGRMDEFAAFARALSATEVHEYYEASTPYK